MASGADLSAPLLGKRSGAGGKREAAGLLAPGSTASSVVLLCSAAIGTGVLALPYAASKVGVFPAVLIFALAALATFTSNVILFMCVREKGLGSYGELMEGILGKNGAMVLDLFVCVEGLIAVATYIVFIMDYVPQVCALGGEDMWCMDPTKVAMAAAAIVWPLSCMQGLSALRYISTCSIVTILFTSMVVIAKAPGRFATVEASLGDALAETHVDMGAFQVLSMACFAFMTHTNTPEIALQLSRPTRGRTWQVVAWHTVLLWLVYCAIAVCGFLSFMSDISQDFLTNYEIRDTFVIMCRCMLSVTLVFACPINICPSIQAFFNILENLQKSSGSQQAPKNMYSNSTLRISVTTGCFALSLGVALRSPKVADLISVLSTFLSSPLMFTFPAMMYRGILKRKDVVVPILLHVFTAALWIAEVMRLLSP